MSTELRNELAWLNYIGMFSFRCTTEIRVDFMPWTKNGKLYRLDYSYNIMKHNVI